MTTAELWAGGSLIALVSFVLGAELDRWLLRREWRAVDTAGLRAREAIEAFELANEMKAKEQR